MRQIMRACHSERAGGSKAVVMAGVCPPGEVASLSTLATMGHHRIFDDYLTCAGYF